MSCYILTFVFICRIINLLFEVIYGTRFSGSGFKGSCIAFINTDHIDKVLYVVKQKYLEKYPKMKEKYSAHVCNTADGIKL